MDTTGMQDITARSSKPLECRASDARGVRFSCSAEGNSGAAKDSTGQGSSRHPPETDALTKLKARSRAPTRYGMLLGRTSEDIAGIRARLDKHSTPEPNTGCWLWAGVVTKDGYGKFGLGPLNGLPKYVAYAHRVAFELANGPIPTGLTIDHRCRQRGCINPAHMEAVTHQENCARRLNGSAIAKRVWAERKARRAA